MANFLLNQQQTEVTMTNDEGSKPLKVWSCFELQGKIYLIVEHEKDSRDFMAMKLTDQKTGRNETIVAEIKDDQEYENVVTHMPNNLQQLIDEAASQ